MPVAFVVLVLLVLYLVVDPLKNLYATAEGALGLHPGPQGILDVVASIDPEHAPELQPGAPPAPPGGTWCNKFIARACAELGAPVPFAPTLVNDQIEALRAQGSGWSSTDADGAVQAALRGDVALATEYNPGGHGHVALVLPYANGVRVAQAGESNFNDGDVSRGFGSIAPDYFVYARGQS